MSSGERITINVHGSGREAQKDSVEEFVKRNGYPNAKVWFDKDHVLIELNHSCRVIEEMSVALVRKFRDAGYIFEQSIKIFDQTTLFPESSQEYFLTGAGIERGESVSDVFGAGEGGGGVGGGDGAGGDGEHESSMLSEDDFGCRGNSSAEGYEADEEGSDAGGGDDVGGRLWVIINTESSGGGGAGGGDDVASDDFGRRGNSSTEGYEAEEGGSGVDENDFTSEDEGGKRDALFLELDEAGVTAAFRGQGETSGESALW